MSAPRFGLCDACAQQKLIGTTRGSTFSMCQIGVRDPDWPKYPRMPVLRCPRFTARERAGAPPPRGARAAEPTGDR